METHLIILFGFMLVLICALGLDASASKHDIRTLRARLDRRDALEAKTAKSPANCAKPKVYTSQLDAWAEAVSVKELKARLAERDETIKHLNGDIAKLKFDYAAEVAGRNEPKRATVEELRANYGGAPLRGEWVDDAKPLEIEVTCGACNGEGLTNVGVKGGKSSIINCPECDGEGSVKV